MRAWFSPLELAGRFVEDVVLVIDIHDAIFEGTLPDKGLV